MTNSRHVFLNQLFPVLIFHLLLLACEARRFQPLAGNRSVEEAIMKAPLKELRQKCLLWANDVRSAEELDWIEKKFGPAFLVRSWYRWGMPDASKLYEDRKNFTEKLESRGFQIGGGGSLSVLNEHDTTSLDFNDRWLARNLDGSPAVRKDKLSLGSLSVPGFRTYLIKEALKQVRSGVRELHFGETTGAIYYDDWTLGYEGKEGYFQWLRAEFSNMSEKDFANRFGRLGDIVKRGLLPPRYTLVNAATKERELLFSEYGKVESWKGQKPNGQSGFLAEIYAKNLSNFILEMRQELLKIDRADVLLSVWGPPPWMEKVIHRPDFFIVSPPDERYGLNWSQDPNFDLSDARPKIFKELAEWVKAAAPAPVLITIDQPKPLEDFLKLSDTRQAKIWEYLKQVADESKSILLLRSYSLERGKLGVATEKVIKDLCAKSRM